jgi:hypothetical protein
MRALSIAFVVGLLAACSGGGTTSPADVDADPGAPDAGPACILPTDTIACTVGDDSPCASQCGESYCYNYSQLPSPVCTEACSSVSDCPSGWSCNMKGRCRPPG